MTIALESIELLKGAHKSAQDGLCAMEAVAYIAGEPHSDHPKCACPVLTRYMQRLNDSMNAVERQRLKPYIPRIIGTRDEHSKERGRVLAWAAITEFLPAMLRAAGLEGDASALEGLERYDWGEGKRLANIAKETARCRRKDAYAADADADASASASAYAADASADAADASASASAYAADASADAAADAASAAASAADAYAAGRAKIWDLSLSALDRALEVK